MKTASILALTAAASICAPAPGSDADAERVIGLLSGSWRSTTGMAEAGGSGAADVVMQLAPISLRDVNNAMYVEQARADSVNKPFRQAIFQVYDYDGSLRLRTLEFKNTPGIRPALVGFWLCPEIFPDLDIDGMYATLELVLTPDGDGFVGKTLTPYPCAINGAVQMTSSISIQPGKLTTTDVGYAPDGSVAWGSTDGVAFERYEPGITANFLGDGLITIDYIVGSGRPTQEGDDVTVHYTGWYTDTEDKYFTAYKFDSTYDRPNGPQPWVFPLPGRLVEGWNRGMMGANIGTVRRLIIPSNLGYGQRGNNGIPPNADLYFEVTVLDAIDPNAPLENQPAPDAQDFPEQPDAGDN